MNFKLHFLSLMFFAAIFLLEMSAPKYSTSYFLASRYYDSKIGRFVNVDPVVPKADSQGQNRYAYVYNDPLKFTDPSGFTPEGGGNDLFSLIHPELAEAVHPETNALTARLDFDTSGQPVAQSPVAVEEDGSMARPVGQTIQAASFATREGFRSTFSFSFGTGKSADVLVLDAIDQTDNRFVDISYQIRDVPDDRSLYSRVVMGPRGSKLGYSPIAADLGVSGTPTSVATRASLRIPGFNSPITLGEVVRHNPNVEMGRLGFSAGLGQIPVVDLDETFKTYTVLDNFKGGAFSASFLGGFGGAASIAAYIDESNFFLRNAGVTLGGAEALGAGTYYYAARLAQYGRTLTQRFGAAYWMRGGSIMMRGAGAAGMAFSAALYLSRADPFNPDSGPVYDMENMSPQKRGEVEDSFIDPGIFGPGSM